jgi:membrane protein DedA with SNARE-associated domain
MELLISIKDTVLALAHEHMALAEPLVFVLGFAESVVLVSLFVPSTVLFLAIGALHYTAGGSFWPVWLAGAAGAFLGDVFSYAVGRYFKEGVTDVWPFSSNPKWYVLSRAFFKRWGMPGIVGSKFLGMVRPVVPVVAGAMGMRWPLFVSASAFSCLVWAGVFLSPGYGIGLFMK